MRRIIKTIGLIVPVFLIWGITACEKDEPDPNGNGEALVFEILKTDRDTLHPGQVARLTAVASGTGLIYNWSATAGDILGSGNRVTYATTPCVAGTVEITCKIEDAFSKTDQKTIQIFVE